MLADTPISDNITASNRHSTKILQSSSGMHEMSGKVASLIALVPMLFHSIFGCCWHHAHFLHGHDHEVVMNAENCVVVESCPFRPFELRAFTALRVARLTTSGIPVVIQMSLPATKNAVLTAR